MTPDHSIFAAQTLESIKQITLLVGFVVIIWKFLQFLQSVKDSIKKYAESAAVQSTFSERMALAGERQSIALETNARLIPLIEASQARFDSLIQKHEQTSMSLRVISRELHEVKSLLITGEVEAQPS